jgi:Ala-tRNA(Pro) deacylase
MSDPLDPADAAVCRALEALGISFVRHGHPPVFTVDEAEQHWAGIEATHCKNLFLRNRKGTRHYLVVAEHRAPVNLARIAAIVGDDKLGFASPERLAKYLGLTPGSVSPFGLINDAGCDVRVVVDVSLRAASLVAFHPNVNTATLVLAERDFERFLASTRHAVTWAALA